MTGSSDLANDPQATEAESQDLLKRYAEEGDGKVVAAILTFNAIRRMHMNECNAENKKQLEAQAWRVIQSVSEKEIDDAPDLGVLLVVTTWGYFTRYWGEGRRGPSITADGSDSYPVEKDFKVLLDHTSAYLHDADSISEDTEEEELTSDTVDEEVNVADTPELAMDRKTPSATKAESTEQRNASRPQKTKTTKNRVAAPSEAMETPRAEVLDESFE
eukprot:GILI01035689.1.p1 GENE.GILI01035689.1~~GILI01035689.1.p1  ORF type:complete len:231 (-),score=33.17 GILI01035689.1:95-745(-)